MHYTGIGSRKTPEDVMSVMTDIAKKLYQKGYTLRSGGAEGADTAFEIGAKEDRMEIYLPYDRFNKRNEDGVSYIVPPYNDHYIYKYHPKPNLLTNKGRLLMSRNTYQVLGMDLKTPSDFVICWTKDGKFSGGTGQALRVAHDNNIRIYNLYNIMDRIQLMQEVIHG